ncbi:MAG TPA: hypothetical protein VHE10_01685 [Candidatus Paceibacterota bacterium]|nr:hypothetical protein [Candidatus Paceibacterota bacterium]
MPLKCIQSGSKLAGKFYVTDRFRDHVICPLSAEIIDKIPESARRQARCEDLEDYLGIDVSVGKANEDAENGGYLDIPLASGKFQFSISRENMYRYIGRLVEYFPERRAPQRRFHRGPTRIVA